MKRIFIVLEIVGIIFGTSHTCLSEDNPPIQLWCPWTKGEVWVAGGKNGYYYGPGPTHKGRDLYAVDFNKKGGGDDGEPILAAADGTISIISYDANGYGNYVKISHAEKCETLYAHLKYDPKEKPGIKQGQFIKHQTS